MVQWYCNGVIYELTLMLMILSSCSDINAKDVLQFFNQKFGGKGGGNPKVAQGKLEKEPKEIIEIIKEFLTKL